MIDLAGKCSLGSGHCTYLSSTGKPQSTFVLKVSNLWMVLLRIQVHMKVFSWVRGWVPNVTRYMRNYFVHLLPPPAQRASTPSRESETFLCQVNTYLECTYIVTTTTTTINEVMCLLKSELEVLSYFISVHISSACSRSGLSTKVSFREFTKKWAYPNGKGQNTW